MKWQRRSLRRRLLVWLMGALVVISAVMMVEVRDSARKAANNAYDRVLLGSALAIAERVVVEGEELEVDIPYVALEMLTSAAQDRVFYQVTGPGEHFITGYADLPPLPEGMELSGDGPLFYDAPYRGEVIRVGVISRYISSPKVSTRFTVKVAETVEARNNLIREMFTGALVRQMVLIVVAGCVLWLGVGWGLRPLARLEEALRRRSPSDLRPVEHQVPREVRHLVEAINDLMQRLEKSIDSMRRFTANAAHQLRTPLAAIQTQVDLALQETEPQEVQRRLEHLGQSARQTSRLVNQLLALARATPEEELETREPVDLLELSKRVTGGFVPRAVEHGIDLGFEGDEQNARDGDVCVLGQGPLLEEALGNLIDNALNYCPRGATVTVRCHRRADAVVLEVEDDGPGIPLSERGKVFERFFRLEDGSAEGCGLGLSIVKEIVQRHGGKIWVGSGQGNKGARFSLEFPKAPGGA